MTKTEAVKYFKENILPSVIERFGTNDKPAVRTEWHYYIDGLCKDGIITEKQYNTWDNPF